MKRAITLVLCLALLGGCGSMPIKIFNVPVANVPPPPQSEELSREEKTGVIVILVAAAVLAGVGIAAAAN